MCQNAGWECAVSIVDELERLSALFQQGTLSEEEYAKAKQMLLSADAPPPAGGIVDEDTDPRVEEDEVTDPNIPSPPSSAGAAAPVSIWTQPFNAGWLLALCVTVLVFLFILVQSMADERPSGSERRVKTAPIPPSAEQKAKRKAREAERKARQEFERKESRQRAQTQRRAQEQRARSDCEARYYSLCRDQRPHDSYLNVEVCKDRAHRRCR